MLFRHHHGKPSRGITFDKIHVEGTRNIIEAARRQAVGRMIHMSALGTRAGGSSRYHQTKWQAEELVLIQRVAMDDSSALSIHGPDGAFTIMEAQWARKRAMPFLFMPYFGSGMLGTGGAGKLQPVFVQDVARAFVEALEKPATIGQVYCIGGPDQMTWPQMHRTAATAIVGKPAPDAGILCVYARLLTHIVPGGLLPFNRDQVVMSQDTCVRLDGIPAGFRLDSTRIRPDNGPVCQ